MSNGNESATALIRQLFGPSLGSMLTLENLPPKLQEIECKYLLGTGAKSTRAHAGFIAKIGSFLEKKRDLPIILSTEFVGVDEYYIIRINGTRLTFRLRMGANRPLELAVKFAIDQKGNEHRGEISLKISENKPETVRFLLSVLAHTDPKAQVFAITQRGIIWHVEDQKGIVEVVCYTVERANDASDPRVFAELEAIKWKDAATALSLVHTYETILGLKKQRCKESIAQLYAP